VLLIRVVIAPRRISTKRINNKWEIEKRAAKKGPIVEAAVSISSFEIVCRNRVTTDGNCRCNRRGWLQRHYWRDDGRNNSVKQSERTKQNSQRIGTFFG
jgi:hypothetical protein